MKKLDQQNEISYDPTWYFMAYFCNALKYMKFNYHDGDHNISYDWKMQFHINFSRSVPLLTYTPCSTRWSSRSTHTA